MANRTGTGQWSGTTISVSSLSLSFSPSLSPSLVGELNAGGIVVMFSYTIGSSDMFADAITSSAKSSSEEALMSAFGYVCWSPCQNFSTVSACVVIMGYQMCNVSINEETLQRNPRHPIRVREFFIYKIESG